MKRLITNRRQPCCLDHVVDASAFRNELFEKTELLPYSRLGLELVINLILAHVKRYFVRACVVTHKVPYVCAPMSPNLEK